MDRDGRTERRENSGKLKRDAKVAKEGTTNRRAKKGEKDGCERKVVIYLTGGDKAAICFHVSLLGID